jgi:hypothetical protein
MQFEDKGGGRAATSANCLYTGGTSDIQINGYESYKVIPECGSYVDI